MQIFVAAGARAVPIYRSASFVFPDADTAAGSGDVVVSQKLRKKAATPPPVKKKNNAPGYKDDPYQ